jgi:tetratricopeptide (TPR) repeat protein/tRNA A-37 threonylcarbamoyl transferase component Bud32
MELTPGNWERAKALFEAVLDQPPAERSALLAMANEDPAVLREVERLLASHSEAANFLVTPPLPSPLVYAHPVPSRSFSPGDLLSGRFRIVRFLARGGMGEVYEAEDAELRERVALKTIRPELLQDLRALDRFKREVHLAKKVTHPNVCRIFDLFRHQLTTTDGGPSLIFVTMELLPGPTLADRLKSGQRLTSEEALPIALQMAAGLGAAHEANVLHRDFKPGNVVLVLTAKGMRAVITDFGLALRSNSDSSLSGVVTGTGESLGTPAYMSPEQVENRELTPASDVYSLGLVLYQMVTGTRPFQDTTPLSMAVRRLKEDPTPPRVLVPDLDRRWEAVVLRCLERDPKDRFPNGDDVAKGLKGEIEVSVSKRRRSGWLAAALIVILMTVALLTPVIRSRFWPQPPAAQPEIASVRLRAAVAVLPLRNLSGHADTDWVSTALSDMLTTELSAGEKLRTVPGENIARASADLGLGGKETLAKDTLGRLRQYLGSDYVVLGAYLDLGSASEGQIRVDLRLQDARSGDILASISEKGNERDLDQVATRAGVNLRQKLGVGEVTPSEAALVKASLPSNPVAVRLYSQGLAKLRVLDAQVARDLLQKAATADPNYALAHSALADAWSMQGYDERAKEESKSALDLAPRLSREEYLWIEGRYWELNRNWSKAVEIYRSLFQFFPDNIDYGLRLAEAQKRARTVDEALATLAALRRLPPPDRNDPRIDLEQAEVLDVKGAYQEQQAAATAAGNRARTLGAQLLLGRALNQIARSLEKQGKLDDSVAAAREAIQISTAADERAEVAKALTIIGIVRFDQGNFSEATNVYHQALVIQRETGDRRGAATTLNNIANALGEKGELADSIKMLQQSLAMFREVGDKHSAAAVLGSMAARTLQQGNLQQAKKMLQAGLTASEEIGDQERSATALYNLGEVVRFQGNLNGAAALYQQALDLSKSLADHSGIAYAMVGLGDVLAAKGDLAGARQKYTEALTKRNQIGEKGTAAETQLWLAVLSLEEERAPEAETAIRRAREQFRKDGSTDDEISADMLLARTLLAQGKAADAQKETSAARDSLAKSQDFSVRLKSAIVTAQVQADAGQFDEGVQALEETIGRAHKSGYLGLELEAKLTLGEMQCTASKFSAGNMTLAEVKKEAQEIGYGLIVSKADEIARKASAKEKDRRSL